jgi:hypothetical protein
MSYTGLFFGGVFLGFGVSGFYFPEYITPITHFFGWLNAAIYFSLVTKK